MTEEELKDLLLTSGLLTPEELKKAIGETKKLRRPLERVILDIGLLSRSRLYEAISAHLGVKYINLENIKIPEELIKIMPEELARRTKSLPLKLDGAILYVVMTDPTDIYAIDQIQLETGFSVEVLLSSPQEIEEMQNKLYLQRSITKDLLADLGMAVTMPEERPLLAESAPVVSTSADVSVVMAPLVEGAPIVKLVDLLIAQAVRDRASDIHLEPEEEITRIRFRIDGILHEIPSPPKEWELPIISRLKVLSGMDIAESRVPQDGHFQAKILDRTVDFRVSTLPTIFGENMVIRLLDTSSVLIGLEKLGFSTYEELSRFENLISKPYGIILSTGPTGSGKTTTLYSALMRINTVERNIVTIEDPVEYRLGLIRQVQVNPKAGITFANGLRSILRQDPDVIMVGEIRDLDTARIAVQAALTGHLVLSTLHTNDAPSAVTRLVDMGIEPYLISASLIGVMAQRLVRLLCEKCKEPYKPSESILRKWGLLDKKDLVLYRAGACEECKGTGYKGRTGIFELMVIDDEIREMIISEASTVALRNKARKKGMRVLSEDGLAKALEGRTSLEEVARVCEERVEIPPGPTVLKVEPFTPLEKKVEVRKIEVKERDLEEYRNLIANWFARKR